MNSALTRSACVCSGNVPPAPSAAGSSGLSPAAIASGSPGLILITSVPGSRLAISRYSALAGSTTSHGMPLPGGGLEQAPDGLRLARPGRAADEHVPVERVGGDGERPRGHQVPVEDLAELDGFAWVPGASPGRSGVTSKSGRSAKRTPGTSASGGRASAASSVGRPVERRGGNAVTAGLDRRCGRTRRHRRRTQRVGQPAEVRRRAEQPGDPRRSSPRRCRPPRR